MKHSHRLYVLIAAGLVAVVITGVGLYGLMTGPDTQPPHPISTPTDNATTHVPLTAPRPKVAGSKDPDAFARNVANTLFTWETGTGLMPLDYSAAILAVSDPSGTEQAGLASDVANYMPSREQWVELRKYSTSQSLTITNSYVPSAWADAVEQAPPGQIPAGVGAITIEATRSREGIWNGTPVSEDFDVSFTVFLACPPKADSCHVLRLSQLDNPLT